MVVQIGSIVKIVRSGMVIPKIVEIVKSVKFQMPVIDGIEIGWNENGETELQFGSGISLILIENCCLFNNRRE